MVDPGLALRVVARGLQDAQLLLGVRGSQDVMVRGVCQDSRRTSPGDLFLAWKGVDTDAHSFVASAVSAGAVAAIVETLIPDLDAPQLHVRDGRLAGALAADLVLGSPWKGLFLAAITGTNGKTTVTALARHLLGANGPARSLGTLGLVEENGSVRPGTEGLTTPGPVQISTWLREMVDDGVTSAVMEASSHALAQRRLDGVRVDAAVFTNLTQDHLDYHADLKEYRSAKARVLELLKPDGWAVVNRDEEAWAGLPTPKGRTLRFGVESGSGTSGVPGKDEIPLLTASELRLLPDGSSFSLGEGGSRAPVRLPLLGRFNVENALAAAAVGKVAGLELEGIASALSSAPQIPGRLERVMVDPFQVLIDYAHTPDALARVMETLRPLVTSRLLVLFGAGGDRDKGKRPLMGAAVAQWADLSFVTSDNPRTESPELIIDDIVAGMSGAPYRRIPDRREAIAAALREARAGDILLLAGKGHETYQVVGTERLPFDEGAIVRDMESSLREEGAA